MYKLFAVLFATAFVALIALSWGFAGLLAELL